MAACLCTYPAPAARRCLALRGPVTTSNLSHYRLHKHKQRSDCLHTHLEALVGAWPLAAHFARFLSASAICKQFSRVSLISAPSNDKLSSGGVVATDALPRGARHRRPIRGTGGTLPAQTLCCAHSMDGHSCRLQPHDLTESQSNSPEPPPKPSQNAPQKNHWIRASLERVAHPISQHRLCSHSLPFHKDDPRGHCDQCACACSRNAPATRRAGRESRSTGRRSLFRPVVTSNLSKLIHKSGAISQHRPTNRKLAAGGLGCIACCRSTYTPEAVLAR